LSDITDEYFLLNNFEGKPFKYPRIS